MTAVAVEPVEFTDAVWVLADEAEQYRADGWHCIGTTTIHTDTASGLTVAWFMPACEATS